jgi:hypothetical protein
MYKQLQQKNHTRQPERGEKKTYFYFIIFVFELEIRRCIEFYSWKNTHTQCVYVLAFFQSIKELLTHEVIFYFGYSQALTR